jgi:hypothetical protein
MDMYKRVSCNLKKRHILNSIWRQIQDGEPVFLNALLQYGYEIKGLDMNNST